VSVGRARIALVTGGGRGIGQGVSLRLAEQGCDVAIVYWRDEESAREVVARIEQFGQRALAVGGDLLASGSANSIAQAVQSGLGDPSIFVSNAGVASRGTPLADAGLDEVEQLVQINVLSPLRLSQLLIPAMRMMDRADIVFISSTVVEQIMPRTGPYAIAKTALEAMATVMAQEEAEHGIHVNVVRPGLVTTEMGARLVRATTGDEVSAVETRFPFKRLAHPDDIADAVAFLVSQQAAYVTGQKLSVHGGVADVSSILARSRTAPTR
jgi:NAD(P)-dependent dehydrogenase (short-subunit alcohol dehydrogenase family)